MRSGVTRRTGSTRVAGGAECRCGRFRLRRRRDGGRRRRHRQRYGGFGDPSSGTCDAAGLDSVLPERIAASTRLVISSTILSREASSATVTAARTCSASTTATNGNFGLGFARRHGRRGAASRQGAILVPRLPPAASPRKPARSLQRVSSACHPPRPGAPVPRRRPPGRPQSESPARTGDADSF